jgi:glycosyltransferase involved in cell wall biosynthesis
LGCDGFVFNMRGERRLLESVWPETTARPGLISGFGIDPPPVGGAAGGGGRFSDSPSVVSVGRVDESKGSLLLADWFAAYKARRPSDLKLVLIGQMVDRPVEHPDIVLAGIVSDADKWAALRGAVAVVQPSPFESLSLALLEGMAVGRPTMVNAACAATTEHVQRSGGGFAFGSYAEFEVALDRLVADPGLQAALGRAGLAYVDTWYRWPRILANYQRFVERLAPAPRPAP